MVQGRDGILRLLHVSSKNASAFPRVYDGSCAYNFCATLSIPLAKKLKDCGVFGKSSDEYLNYAVQNRREWELRGQEVVAEMIASMVKEAQL